MGLTIWEGPPILIGETKLIAKMFSCVGLGEATEEDVETYMLEQVEKGLARKVGETWIYCEDPEVVKRVAESWPESIVGPPMPGGEDAQIQK